MHIFNMSNLLGKSILMGCSILIEYVYDTFPTLLSSKQLKIKTKHLKVSERHSRQYNPFQNTTAYKQSKNKQSNKPVQTHNSKIIHQKWLLSICLISIVIISLRRVFFTQYSSRTPHSRFLHSSSHKWSGAGLTQPWVEHTHLCKQQKPLTVYSAESATTIPCCRVSISFAREVGGAVV